MKERYLETGFLQSVVRGDLDRLGLSFRSESWKDALKDIALIVLDMQNYFLDRSSHAFIPDAPAIVPRIKDLSQVCDVRRIPIIYTRHLNTPSNAGMMNRWWRDIIPPDDPIGDIIPDLDVSDCEVLDKTQYDAFHKTRLYSILRDHGVQTVIITGVMTHLCCETTARSAFIQGFQVIFPVDATATYNANFHRASLINLAHGFASVMTTAELIQSLTNESMQPDV